MIKLLKENQEFLHYSISNSTGKIIKNIISKNPNIEEVLKQTDMIIGMFASNLKFLPN